VPWAEAIPGPLLEKAVRVPEMWIGAAMAEQKLGRTPRCGLRSKTMSLVESD